MKTFRVKRYDIVSPKIPAKKTLRMALLADQHNVCFGEENEQLLRTLREEHPDVVLLAGDMICRRELDAVQGIERFLCRLAEEFPVYYGMGNHESYEVESGEAWYIEYERRLRKAGVICLHNRQTQVTIGSLTLHIAGLELPLDCYRKPFPLHPSLYSLTKRIGDPAETGLNILIAHNPMFADTYFQWGADVIVSGHYHGGVLRFTEHCGAVSPQMRIFPRYCCGLFQKGKQYLVVSPGLGEHTVTMRIHNPRELILLTLKPAV
ncbi:MAG: metallophosphoesterase [Blautia sp.]|nr:metallophosphoesterase [Blautia sp.]